VLQIKNDLLTYCGIDIYELFFRKLVPLSTLIINFIYQFFEMKKIFLSILLSCAFSVLMAQQTTANKYSYYIEIKEPGTKAGVAKVSSVIRIKPGVTLFNHYRTARPFFVLLSQTPVDKAMFQNWVQPLGMQVLQFEAKEITAAFIRTRRLEKRAGTKADQPSVKRN
jgi:hypothetical protein